MTRLGRATIAVEVSGLRQRPKVPDRSAGRDGLRRGDDGISVDAVEAVEVGQRSGLAEMLHAKWAYTVARNRPQPGERRRMSIQER